MRPAPVSFNVDFMAGRTVDTLDGRPVDRPGGMDGWILNYTSEGVGRINRGDHAFTVQPGTFLLFKPLAPHDYGYDRAVGRWVHLWVYFFPRAPWYDWLTWTEASPGILRLDAQGHQHLPRAVSAFEELVAVARGALPRRTAMAMSMLEQVLLWIDAMNPGSKLGRLDPRIQSAVDHCHERFADAVTIATLARLAGLSPSRFAHVFKAQLGATPLVYLEQVRIHAAREHLLLTGRPVAEIAEMVGFPDAVWFSRCFRRRVGCSPREFRRRGH